MAPQNRVLDEVLSAVADFGQRDRERPQRREASHDGIDVGLIYRLGMSPDHLSYTAGELAQVLQH